jgi:dCMP deaminase
MKRIPWDIHFMDHALLAADMSTCLTRHTGAVVVQRQRIVATGFNGNVPKAKHCVDGGCERCTARQRGLTEAEQWENSERMRLREPLIEAGQDLGQCVCVHAEANAIAQCARLGQTAEDGWIYATHRPCLDCVKLIAVAGIVRVIYLNDYPAEYTVPPTIKLEQLDV